jgi:hypothetical protein
MTIPGLFIAATSLATSLHQMGPSLVVYRGLPVTASFAIRCASFLN